MDNGMDSILLLLRSSRVTWGKYSWSVTLRSSADVVVSDCRENLLAYNFGMVQLFGVDLGLSVADEPTDDCTKSAPPNVSRTMQLFSSRRVRSRSSW